MTRTDNNEYQLVDFGNGRKLERVAGRLIDRPSPAAIDARARLSAIWEQAESRFDGKSKRWEHRTSWPQGLSIECVPGVLMPANPTPYGHIGLFPEQRSNWRWLVKTAPPNESSRLRGGPSKALNLFGYTGASSLVMAATGMAVAHVDAAKPNVVAAREAARRNGLDEAPIRYLVDDAVKFTRRENRRGNRYHTVILDPPAYGHSPNGKAWRLSRDLAPLISDVLELLRPPAFRLLVTGHSAELGQNEVLTMLKNQLDSHRLRRCRPIYQTGRMTIEDESGRQLDAGFFVRCFTESFTEISHAQSDQDRLG